MNEFLFGIKYQLLLKNIVNTLQLLLLAYSKLNLLFCKTLHDLCGLESRVVMNPLQVWLIDVANFHIYTWSNP